MRNLRWLYWIDGFVLLVTGLLLWGWSNGPAGMKLLGMRDPGGYSDHLPEWRAIGFAGEFGGALMAFGFAALAIAYVSREDRIQRSAVPYFLAGHFFLGFVVWAKTMAFGATPAGLILVVITIYPGAAFLYALFSGFSWPWTFSPGVSDSELRIQEAAGQAERSRLAQDLHDSVKQQVYAVQTSLAAAQARWDTDARGAREAIDHARSTAQDAMTEMTALLDRLRRDPVESAGLVEALRRQTEALKYQSGAEVSLQFDSMPDASHLPAGAMSAVFRIAQEAIANIARHARARHVNVTAGVAPGSDAFVLTIADDGQGFAETSPTSGMGLANIRARAAEAGGWANIWSKTGEGCTVTVSVPLVDPRSDLVWRHNTSLVVSLIILLPTAVLTWYWAEARAYLSPLAAAALSLAAFHALTAGSLRWRAR